MLPQQVRGSASESAPALTDGPPVVAARRHPSADRVEATAETLYRLLWGRLPGSRARRAGTPYDPLDDPAYAARITVTGDESRVRAYLGSRLVP